MKKKVCAWMNRQILAQEIRNTSLYKDRPFDVCIAGVTGREIHVYGIENLCKEADMLYEVEEYNDEYDCYFFMYKDYKFFGLIKRGKELDERK